MIESHRPVLPASFDRGGLGLLAWTGAAVWLAAAVLEGDRELARFKADESEAPYGRRGLVAPAPMLYLILFVTGVPAAEESSLRSRGEEYRRRRRETSAFVPWFPREAA